MTTLKDMDGVITRDAAKQAAAEALLDHEPIIDGTRRGIPAEEMSDAANSLLQTAEGRPPHHTENTALIEQLHNQIHMARYCFHKVRIKQYGDAVREGHITVANAQTMYVAAMMNYDQLLAAAPGGAHTSANQLDMEQGFVLPEATVIAEE